MIVLNSSTVPRRTPRQVCSTPIPSGSIRSKSSKPPDRVVGRTMPTVPSRLLGAAPLCCSFVFVKKSKSARGGKERKHVGLAQRDRLQRADRNRGGGQRV